MIGVVIVTWNSADVIGECLDGCLALNDVHVVVVDNASADNTVEVVRERAAVTLIANRENRGFAAGVNQGIAELETDAVLLLNPDAAPVTSLDALARVLRMPGIGAAGGRLTGPDGRNQDGFNVRSFPTAATLALETLGMNRLFPANPWNREYRRTIIDAGDVDQPAGAFLMLNRHAWRAVGGFDEGFRPAWFEDVDFCLRLRKAGYGIRYVPEAIARHVGGHSASALSWEARQLFWYSNLLRYAAKHFTLRGRRLVAGAVLFACIPRALAGAITQKSLAAASVYSKVFRLGLQCWQKPVSSQTLSSEWTVTEGEPRPQ